MLEAIEVQQGLLVERATDTYSFSHLTIQEYLTAQHIIEQDLLDEAVAEHATDKRWREVFLLLSGLLGEKVPKLWQGLKNAAIAYVEASHKLENLVRWANSISDTAHNSYGTRAAALHISANAITSAKSTAIAIARAITSARAIDGVNQMVELQLFNARGLTELAQQLIDIKQAVPNESAAMGDWLQWRNWLMAAWLNGFDLTEEDITLSRKDAEAFNNYLYLTELIIRCKESAVRVSKKEWEAIEAQLLTPPEDKS
ncbi:MAG: hypothetical protein WBA10_13305 [Elainellaceae cyanobacterium]